MHFDTYRTSTATTADCCLNRNSMVSLWWQFWGPFLPLFGGETDEEVGGSWLVWDGVLKQTRILSAIILIFQCATTTIDLLGKPTNIWTCLLSFYFSFWSLLGFAFLADGGFVLARIGAVLHHASSANALALAVIGTLYLVFDPLRMKAMVIASYFIPLGLALIDRGLGSKLRFRVSYLPIGPLLFSFLAMSFHITIEVLEKQEDAFVEPGKWSYVSWQLMCAGVCCGASLIWLLITRISILCIPRKPRSPSSNDWVEKQSSILPEAYATYEANASI